MQNLDAGWDQMMESGKLMQPFSKYSKMTYIDYRDVAEIAAIAMTGDHLNYGTFDLSFRGMYNRIEIAKQISEVSGRIIEAEEVPFEDWASSTKIPEGPIKEGLKAMYANYNKNGFKGGNDIILRALLNREPKTLQDYLREMAYKEEITQQN